MNSDTDPFESIVLSPKLSSLDEMIKIETTHDLTDQSIDLHSLTEEIQLELNNLANRITVVLKNRSKENWQEVTRISSMYTSLYNKEKDVRRLIELRSELSEVN
jgi:hypothetical protein